MNRNSPSGSRRSTRFLLASLAAILAVACGKKAPEVPGSVAEGDSEAESNLASSGGHDPCSLLEPKDVEAALGGSPVGPPYRFSTRNWGPAGTGDACRYEGVNHHFIQVAVDWEGGAQTMNMYGIVQNMANQRQKGVLKLADGSELTGEWDEARVQGCCSFMAMRGDQLVTVDVAGSNATLEQAAAIADAALKRIDKPLPGSGAAGVAAAIARDATRPKERDPCSLVTRTEAEAALEAPLTKEPERDHNTCTYTYTGKLPWSIAITLRWRDGYTDFRQHTALAADVYKSFSPGGGTGQAKKESAVPDAALVGPWETAHVGLFEFSAVKQDVLIRADARGAMKQEHARNLVAAAMSKL